MDAQEIIDRSDTKTAQDVINSSSNFRERKPMRRGIISSLKESGRRFFKPTQIEYRSQRSYGGVTQKNISSVARKASPVQGNYRKGYRLQKIRSSAPMTQQSASKVTSFIAGRRIPGVHSKGYSRAGRPKGTYKYYIPNVGPVGVFEWRKYQRMQQRKLAMQIQQQSPQLSYPQARAALQQVQRQMPVQPQNYQPQPSYQQPVPMQQPPQIPADDGWGLLRIKSPFSGMAARPVNPIANSQMPVGNRYTAYYSEPDFISGKQVFKQRPNVGGFGLW